MKNLINKEPKTVTLKHVVSRAKKDKVFFNSLVKAPKTTLKNNALKLSDADGNKLNTQIAKARRTKVTFGWTDPPQPWWTICQILPET